MGKLLFFSCFFAGERNKGQKLSKKNYTITTNIGQQLFVVCTDVLVIYGGAGTHRIYFWESGLHLNSSCRID